MENIAIKLDAFEGPLDLLLHLIEKEKIDIYDIPIFTVTEQYIKFLQNQQEFDLELASEFLLMAATLLQIKSRMLLPKEAKDHDEDELDPRQELMKMLIEYRRFKQAALILKGFKTKADKYLSRKPMFTGICTYDIPNYSISDLLKALMSALCAKTTPIVYIDPQTFSVQQKMTIILQLLNKHPQGILFDEMIRTNQSGEKVAAFLGVLELLRLGLIKISQLGQFTPIYIFPKQEESSYVSR